VATGAGRRPRWRADHLRSSRTNAAEGPAAHGELRWAIGDADPAPAL